MIEYDYSPDDPEAHLRAQIPYIRDQLTRVRLQSAKKARRGDDLDQSRLFENINPIVVAMWHMKQDFLEVHACFSMALYIIIKNFKLLNSMNMYFPIFNRLNYFIV